MTNMQPLDDALLNGGAIRDAKEQCGNGFRTMTRGYKALYGLIGLVIAKAVLAAEFHIAPTGSDANSGTVEQPLATLEKARDMARQSKDPAKTVTLAPGRYFLAEPLRLDERDSGVVWRGEAKGATAEIYGGVPVTGWEKWKGGIWRAPVPKGKRFFNLIVDGQSATMAQTPNKGSGFGGGAWKINNGAVGVPKEWHGYDYSDAQVFGFIGANWFSEMRAVTKSAPDANGTLPIDGGNGGQFGGLNGRFFMRGVLEFLDEPGEWCLKHQEGYVYYWPKIGTPAGHLILRPAGERTFDIEGRSPATPAKNITLENVSVIGSDFCNRWYLFPPGQDAMTPAPLQQGMVFGENVEHLTVRNCRLLAAGHSAVWLNKQAQHCVVENNLIMDAGFAGVYMNGWTIGEGPFKDAAESYVNKGHRIESNFIYDCGQFVGAGCGIQFYQSGDNLITRNEIGQMPRYGISYKGIRWGCIPKNQYGQKLTFENHFDFLHTRRNRIVGNEIYSVCRNSFDYGAIECWGPGRDNLWASNDLHDLDQALEWDGWAHVLFADDASHWLTISGNIIHHCYGGSATGAFMLKNIEEVIENNVVVDCRMGRLITFSPYMEPSWNMTIRRNVFAVDGVNQRYGDINEYSLKGKDYLEVKVPPDATGFREVNHNFITPADPSNPNPHAAQKMDLNSVFDAKLVTCKAPTWDATRFDYQIKQLPGVEFRTSTLAEMGLTPGFPFDKAQATRRAATDKIQAEDYQRMNGLRTSGGFGIYAITKGSWAKYANIDFADGRAAKAVFQLDAPATANVAEPFIRRYGDTVVEATPFIGDKSVETITQWEISKPYRQPGKSGIELFDVEFAPEKDIRAGEWKPWLVATTSRAGVTSPAGVVDLDVANGEGNANACAYLRASIYAPIGRNNASMTASCASGVKVWLNGKLIIARNEPGTHTLGGSAELGVINQGWNTILIKVNQDNAPWLAKTQGDGNFWVKFGTVASGCGAIVYLPGLPTVEKAATASGNTIVELRLDAPIGKLIGRVPVGQTTCPVEKIAGVHSLFLVFPNDMMKMVDWFRFE